MPGPRSRFNYQLTLCHLFFERRRRKVRTSVRTQRFVQVALRRARSVLNQAAPSSAQNPLRKAGPCLLAAQGPGWDRGQDHGTPPSLPGHGHTGQGCRAAARLGGVRSSRPRAHAPLAATTARSRPVPSPSARTCRGGRTATTPVPRPPPPSPGPGRAASGEQGTAGPGPLTMLPTLGRRCPVPGVSAPPPLGPCVLPAGGN